AVESLAGERRVIGPVIDECPPECLLEEALGGREIARGVLDVVDFFVCGHRDLRTTGIASLNPSYAGGRGMPRNAFTVRRTKLELTSATPAWASRRSRRKREKCSRSPTAICSR